ncbi:MAG: T9SS type A sorting domain-containing protein [Bacteroidetes bacterium]|nr:T9SS type A sorting domain-containing protein [Bacteroidota bacterium]
MEWPNSFASSIQNIVISNAQVNMSGVYTVTVTNLIGCSATASTTASVTSCNCVQPIVQLGKTNVSCNGGSDGTITTTINNVAGPFTYLWSNGMTVQNPTGLPIGIYTVTVTTTPNCTGTSSIVITQPTVLTASSTVTNTTCGTSNGSVVMNVSGGSPPYQYLWNTNPPQNTSVISSLTAGSYLCTVTDSKGCTKTLVSIVQTTGGSISNVTVTIKKPCYQDNNGKLTIKNITGGTAPYTYLWSTGAVSSSISNISNGTYTLTVTDAGNCSFVKVLNVVQWSQIKENLTVIDAGCNLCNGIAYVAPTGGKKPYRYSWNTVPLDLDSLATGLCAGAYTLTIRDTANCVKQVPVVVSDGRPQITAAITNVICNGGNTGAVNITVTSGVSPFSYLWSNGKTSKNNLNATAGIYTITVTSTGGCSNTKSSLVTEPAAIAISFDTTSTTAKAVPVGGVSPYAYLWSNGKTNAKILNLTVGTYTVTVTDASGCTKVASVTVNGPRFGEMDLIAIADLSVYPNPASEFLNIEFDALGINLAEISVYNEVGQMCISKSISTQHGTTQIRFETTSLASGIYELRIEFAGTVERRKIVVASNK